jgi:hypothetical protein
MHLGTPQFPFRSEAREVMRTAPKRLFWAKK